MATVVLNGSSEYVSESNDLRASLNELDDVTLTSTVDGQIMVYDGGVNRWVNQDQVVIPTYVLNDLTDINITTVTDGDILKYDNATSEWINTEWTLKTVTSGGAVALESTSTAGNVLSISDADYQLAYFDGVNYRYSRNGLTV